MTSEEIETSNLDLWDKVEKTPRAHTSAFNNGKFSGTAIKPIYLIKRATELWGPMGIKWGARTISTHIEDNIVYMLVEVHYPTSHTEKVGTVQHWGGDVMFKGANADKPNDEAFKMAFTDGISKCLSMLGFGGDVHMGRFDDSKYKAESSAAAAKRRYAEIEQELLECDDPRQTWQDYKYEIAIVRGNPDVGQELYSKLEAIGMQRVEEMERKVANGL